MVCDQHSNNIKDGDQAHPEEALVLNGLLRIQGFDLFFNPLWVLEKSRPDCNNLLFVEPDEETRIDKKADPGN